MRVHQLFIFSRFPTATLLCLYLGVFSGAHASKAGIELRGFFEVGTNQSFSIYFTDLKQSSWLEFNKPRHGVILKSYDADSKNLTVEYQGETHVLRLKEPDMAPLVVITNSPNTVQRSIVQESDSDYNDQHSNPDAAQLVLEAVQRRQQQRQIHSYQYASGSGISNDSSNIADDSNSATGDSEETLSTEADTDLNHPLVTRNRVYNIDYEAVR